MSDSRKLLEPVPPLATERNRYFTGKYIAAADLTDEQSYFLSQVRHTNRLACGFGVVEGFDVACDARDDCRDWVTVTPGIAIDQWGRFVALREPRNVRLPVRRSRSETDEEYGYGRLLPLDSSFLLVARYDEELVDGSPPLVGPSESPGSELEFGRVRECVRIEVVPLAGVPLDYYAGLAAMHEAAAETRSGDDANSARAQSPNRAEPVAVPLALIDPRYESDDPTADDLRLAVTQQGRLALIQAPGNATRIVGLSWPHNGTVPMGAIGNLSVRFSRPLAADSRGLVGEICEIWTRSPDHRVTPMLLAESQPFRLDNNNRELKILLAGTGRPKPGDTIFVKLNCDFILDRDDRAVDGTFLGGRLPTGNGTLGGQFESWFKIAEGRGRNAGDDGDTQPNGDEDGT